MGDFFKIKVYFYLTVLFCLEHDNVLHRWKVYEKSNNLTYNMLKSVVICGSYSHFYQHTRYHEIAKNTNTTVKRYVDELVSRRTMGHLIENKANLRDLIAVTGLVISNWIQIVNFSAHVTVKFDGWPCKTIGHLFYATSSFVHHFVPIGEFKLELQSGNAQFGSKSTIFLAVWPRNFTDDPQKQ